MSNPTAEQERICPRDERRYMTMCNQGLCMEKPVGDTGYCKYHGSRSYVLRMKWIRKIGVWGAVAVVGPPLVISVATILWRFALWVVLND